MSGKMSGKEKGSRHRGAYMKKRIDSLLDVDHIRMLRIAEMLQYTVVYAVLGFMCAFFADWIIPSYDGSRGVVRQVFDILVQLCICSVSIFYIKKMAKVMPLVFPYPDKFRPYETFEYSGGIALNVMFLMVQPNLGLRIRHLTQLIRGVTG